MKRALMTALVGLVVLAPGCDGVFGSFQLTGRVMTVRAVSDDSGNLVSGQMEVVIPINDRYFWDVTCLKIAGNKATIGASIPEGDRPPAGYLMYVEDLPGDFADRVQEEFLGAPPPTTCPAPPETVRQDGRGGNVWIFDDVEPPQQPD